MPTRHGGSATGQSEAIHSPEARASIVVKLTTPASLSIAVF
jgi:hypothetical protein